METSRSFESTLRFTPAAVEAKPVKAPKPQPAAEDAAAFSLAGARRAAKGVRTPVAVAEELASLTVSADVASGVTRDAERGQHWSRVRPGVVLIRRALSACEQQHVVDAVEGSKCTFHTPAFKAADGTTHALKCRVATLGGTRWDAASDAYVADPAAAQTIPQTLLDMARRCAETAATADPLALGASSPAYDAPDVLLANFYESRSGKMGLHQDNSEQQSALDRGSPVVSISIGADATFALANARDARRARLTLRSGDAIIFGGPARHLFHGVENVAPPDTMPPHLAMRPGRLNLTFRTTR